MLREARDFHSETLPSMLSWNPRKFWQIVNPSANHPVKLNDDDDNPIPEHLCADILNYAFASALKRDSPSNVCSYHDLNVSFMSHIIISPAGIANIIDGLKFSLPLDFDSINLTLLKGTQHTPSLFFF